VICVLDSGVSAAHPLIAKGMTGARTLDEAWGTDDHTGDLGKTRTMLMAAALAHQQIEELEAAARTAPASDRIVSLDHNKPSSPLSASLRPG